MTGEAVEDVADQLANQAEIPGPEATSRAGRRPQAQTRGDHGFFGIERHGVLVARHAGAFQTRLGVPTLQSLGP